MFGGIGDSGIFGINKQVEQVEDMGKRFKIKKDFKLSVKSLKIACNFPEMKDSTKCYVMDVFTFL